MRCYTEKPNCLRFFFININDVSVVICKCSKTTNIKKI